MQRGVASAQSQRKTAKQLVPTVQPGWRQGFMCRVSCWGPGETSPDSELIWPRRTCGHRPAGPRPRSWVGGGLCHPVLGPGKEPGWSLGSSVRRAGAAGAGVGSGLCLRVSVGSGLCPQAGAAGRAWAGGSVLALEPRIRLRSMAAQGNGSSPSYLEGPGLAPLSLLWRRGPSPRPC